MTAGFLMFAIGLAMVYSALKDQTIAETLAGVVGPDVPLGESARTASGDVGSGPRNPLSGLVPQLGIVSPFPRSTKVNWGRSDQGVDGTVRVGTPFRALAGGTIEIAHDPGGFGSSYPVLHTSRGSFYYGHVVPTVRNGQVVRAGQTIGRAHPGTWGNSTTPGGFEIGVWPPGSMHAGDAIRSWLQSLVGG